MPLAGGRERVAPLSPPAPPRLHGFSGPSYEVGAVRLRGHLAPYVRRVHRAAPVPSDPYVLAPDAIEPPRLWPQALRVSAPAWCWRQRSSARRADRDDDARRAGRLRRPLGHRPQLRHQARRPGRVRPLHDCDRAHRARRVQPRARPSRRRGLAGLDLGRDGDVDAPAGRRHVWWRRAGAAHPRAGDPGQRLGGCVLCRDAGAPPRRWLRTHRASRDRQGRALHAAHRLRRRDSSPPARRGHCGRSSERIQFPIPGCGAGDGDCCLRHHRRRRDRAGHVPCTGAWRRATRGSSESATALEHGRRARAAGFA